MAVKRTDIAYIPLIDAATVEVALVWRTADECEIARAFARLAAGRPVTVMGAKRCSRIEPV